MKSLATIDALVSQLFAERWIDLHAGESLAKPDLKYPGVYLLAYSGCKLDGMVVEVRDVFYVGMSNAAGGVRARLRQFKDGIESNRLHSGAMRFFRDYCMSRPFSEAATGRRLFFAAVTVECVSNKVAASPDDLRQMGHVACAEYYAIAHVAAKSGKKPPLNKLGTMPRTDSGLTSGRFLPDGT